MAAGVVDIAVAEVVAESVVAGVAAVIVVVAVAPGNAVVVAVAAGVVAVAAGTVVVHRPVGRPRMDGQPRAFQHNVVASGFLWPQGRSALAPLFPSSASSSQRKQFGNRSFSLSQNASKAFCLNR